MRFEDTIEILLRRGAEGQGALGRAEWNRVKARVAWVRERLAAWWEALQHQHERCCAGIDKLSDAEFERLCDEEQAKVDAIRAEIDAVIEQDRWPPEVYWSSL